MTQYHLEWEISTRRAIETRPSFSSYFKALVNKVFPASLCLYCIKKTEGELTLLELN